MLLSKQSISRPVKGNFQLKILSFYHLNLSKRHFSEEKNTYNVLLYITKKTKVAVKPHNLYKEHARKKPGLLITEGKVPPNHTTINYSWLLITFRPNISSKNKSITFGFGNDGIF